MFSNLYSVSSFRLFSKSSYGNWAGVGSGSIPGAAFYAKRAATAAVNHLRGRNAYTPYVGKTFAVRHGDQSYQHRPREVSLPFGGSSGHAMKSWPVAGRASATSSGPSTRSVGDVSATASINGGASAVPGGETRETAKLAGVEIEEDRVAVAA